MIYLENFRFPTFDKEEGFLPGYYGTHPRAPQSTYPFRMLSSKGLYSLDFSEVTILYGGNGSGKSTAINTICHKLGVTRTTPYNESVLQPHYSDLCTYSEGEWYDGVLLKDKATLMTSDDIFKYMLDTRQKNAYITRRGDLLADEVRRIRSGNLNPHELDAKRRLDFETGENVDTFLQMQRMKQKSCVQFVKESVGEIARTYSNGETGFISLAENIIPDRLYLLDEPENSLSCELQMKLAQCIEESARFCNCQFIIATHSPFLLALRVPKSTTSMANPQPLPSFGSYLICGYTTTYSNSSRRSFRSDGIKNLQI